MAFSIVSSGFERSPAEWEREHGGVGWCGECSADISDMVGEEQRVGMSWIRRVA